MGGIFLGPVRFWIVWLIVLAALFVAGRDQLHVWAFSWFLGLLALLAAASVLAIVFTRRTGERITREPLEPDEN
jgi:membrane protein implicated in regulation of membrane protease activity